jgi:hypothetical protein
MLALAADQRLRVGAPHRHMPSQEADARIEPNKGRCLALGISSPDSRVELIKLPWQETAQLHRPPQGKIRALVTD